MWCETDAVWHEGLLRASGRQDTTRWVILTPAHGLHVENFVINFQRKTAPGLFSKRPCVASRIWCPAGSCGI